MAKYKKIPVIIEALTFNELYDQFIRYKGIYDNYFIFGKLDHKITHDFDNDQFIFDTLGSNNCRMTREDMLIIGTKGEIYPCKIDIFEKTYEKVE